MVIMRYVYLSALLASYTVGAQSLASTNEEKGLVHDVIALPGWIWQAEKSTFSNSYSKLWLGSAAAISLAYVFDDNIDESLKKNKPFQKPAEEFDMWGKVAYTFGWAGFYITGKLIDNQKLVTTGRNIVITNIAANLVGTVLWFSVGRRRPNIAKNKHDFDPFNTKNLKLTIPPFAIQPSFPSLHTVGMSSIAIVLTKHYGYMYGVPAYVLAGVVGYSRMTLEGHFLSDVVAGACLGTITGLAVCEFMDAGGAQRISVYPSVNRGHFGVGVRLELR